MNASSLHSQLEAALSYHTILQILYPAPRRPVQNTEIFIFQSSSHLGFTFALLLNFMDGQRPNPFRGQELAPSEEGPPRHPFVFVAPEQLSALAPSAAISFPCPLAPVRMSVCTVTAEGVPVPPLELVRTVRISCHAFPLFPPSAKCYDHLCILFQGVSDTPATAQKARAEARYVDKGSLALIVGEGQADDDAVENEVRDV